MNTAELEVGLQTVQAERDSLEASLNELLAEIETHRLQVQHAPWADSKADDRLYAVAQKVREG